MINLEIENIDYPKTRIISVELGIDPTELIVIFSKLLIPKINLFPVFNIFSMCYNLFMGIIHLSFG